MIEELKKICINLGSVKEDTHDDGWVNKEEHSVETEMDT